MPAIEFPTSTAPGIHTTESGGRLINAYAEPAPSGSRSKVVWRRAPGLADEFELGAADHRGHLVVGSVLYVINGTTAYSITGATGAFTITELTGTVPGEGLVMLAHNMRAPTPQLLVVHSDGMSQIDIGAGSVADFSDPDLPSANSITFMDGYFFVTSADGRVFASGINDVTFSGSDYASGEAAPDGIQRAVSFGRDLLLMGTYTTEFWGNAGNATGFPFSRGPVITLGLKGRFAVAGYEPGFPDAICWVAQDNTVRRLVGYSPDRISSPTLERLIEATHPDELEASVFVAGGHAFWVLSSSVWTWVYDMSTGEWHERESYGQPRWRAHLGVNAFGKWLVFDNSGPKVFSVNARGRREGTQPLVWRMQSSQASGFPGRFVVKRASFDINTGVGIDRGISPIETDPKLAIRWSDDGGRTWGQPLLRRLGSQGESVPVDIFRAGLTSRHGRIWELMVSDPVDVALYGALMDIEQRSA